MTRILKGVEIGCVGTYGKRTMRRDHLLECVSSFDPDHDIPVLHSDHQGDECGTVVGLAMQGEYLTADLELDVGAVDDVKARRLVACSVEMNPDHDGLMKLVHVALLPPDQPPGCTGLHRLHHFLADDHREHRDHRERDVHRYDASQLRSIRGIEIFRTGRWNNDDYDLADLQAMIDAFPRVGFRPPVTLGHDTASGDRAFGWVTGLRLVGETLVADFGDVPEPLVDIIKERGYDAVSAEIYWDVERDGVIYKRALKSVALLGAQTPAVADLAPLRTVVNTYPDVAVHVHELQTKEAEMAEQDAGAALVEMARQYMHQNPGARMSMMAALEAVRLTPSGMALCHKWATGARPYVSPGRAVLAQQRSYAARQGTDTEIDAKAREYISTHKGVSYQQAVAAVLNGDHALRARYAGGRP